MSWLLLWLAFQARQNPSPMADTTREHPRPPMAAVTGRRETLSLGTLLLHGRCRDRMPVVLHFHGAGGIAEQGAAAHWRNVAVVTVQLGAGSSVYAAPFAEPGRYASWLAEIAERSGCRLGPVYLTAWSAGYGAVREILRQGGEPAGILLMDAMHAGYIAGPEGKGSAVDPADVEVFLAYAREAAAGRRRMLVTHSEVYPGTFASTTETADWLLGGLGLHRERVLRWGPGGMQQTSQVTRGRFRLLGFAGNSAPDHVDHLYGYAAWIRELAPRR